MSTARATAMARAIGDRPRLRAMVCSRARAMVSSRARAWECVYV